MTAHKHAALMALYAQDAAETDKPWERWEYKRDGSNAWRNNFDTHPAWDDNIEYRRKPKTIRIGEFDVPEPMRVAPPYGTPFWVPRLDSWGYSATDQWTWTNHEADHTRMNSGLAHFTVEAAITHRKALLSLTQVK